MFPLFGDALDVPTRVYVGRDATPVVVRPHNPLADLSATDASEVDLEESIRRSRERLSRRRQHDRSRMLASDGAPARRRLSAWVWALALGAATLVALGCAFVGYSVQPTRAATVVLPRDGASESASARRPPLWSEAPLERAMAEIDGSIGESIRARLR